MSFTSGNVTTIGREGNHIQERKAAAAVDSIPIESLPLKAVCNTLSSLSKL